MVHRAAFARLRDRQMELGSLPVPARVNRTGSVAGRVESGYGVVSGISTRARDGDLQCRDLARLAAGAYNRRVAHDPLWLAIRVRLHGPAGLHLVGRLVDSVSAATPEPLAQAQR